VLCFDLANIGKCKRIFSTTVKKFGKCFQQICIGVSGLWVWLGKIKCGVFGLASAMEKHNLKFC